LLSQVGRAAKGKRLALTLRRRQFEQDCEHGSGVSVGVQESAVETGTHLCGHLDELRPSNDLIGESGGESGSESWDEDGAAWREVGCVEGDLGRPVAWR